MKLRKNIIILIIVLFSFLTFVNTINNVCASGKTWYVDDDDGGKDFTKIQDAIDNTSNGDTIYVYSGIYHEEIDILISCNIKLIGEEKNTTIIDVGKDDNVIAIHHNSDGCTITGFTIINSRESCSGIEINSNSNYIYDNIFINNRNGIYLFDGENNLVTDNIIINSSNFAIAISSDYNIVHNNTIINNLGYGISLFFAYHNMINHNYIADNKGGFTLHGSEKNTIIENYISNNTIDSENFYVNNTYSGYNYGFEIWADSNNNTIYHNDVINNTENLYIYEGFNNIWDNNYPSGGNYWSDFDEPSEGAWDNDTDGIIDTSYIYFKNFGIKKNIYEIDRYPLKYPFTDLKIIPHEGIDYKDIEDSSISNDIETDEKDVSSNNTPGFELILLLITLLLFFLWRKKKYKKW